MVEGMNDYIKPEGRKQLLTLNAPVQKFFSFNILKGLQNMKIRQNASFLQHLPDTQSLKNGISARNFNNSEP